MSRKPISAEVVIRPLTPDQKEWGLKGAVEALDLLLKEKVTEERVNLLRKEIIEQLKSVSKN